MEHVEKKMSEGEFPERWALVAGDGALPEEIARRLATEKGRRGVIYVLGGRREALEPWGEVTISLERVCLASTVADMLRRGVRGVVLAGSVPKNTMYRASQLDDTMRDLLRRLPENNDHALLGAVVALLESSGLSVLRYGDVLDDLLAPEGILGCREPSSEEGADVAYGVTVASKLVPLSFGQTVVVRDRAVVAVEAMEGTDETLERAGRWAAGGAVVKLMRRDQDDRYDLPVVGPRTLRIMGRWGLRCLAVEKGRTILLDRKNFLALADAEGIAVVGIDPARELEERMRDGA